MEKVTNEAKWEIVREYTLSHPGADGFENCMGDVLIENAGGGLFLVADNGCIQRLQRLYA